MRTPRRHPRAGAEPPTRPPVRGRRAHAGPPADERFDLDEAMARTMPTLSTRAGALPLRPRTVRARVVCLLMVPVVSLLALWAYATVSTAQDIARLRQTQRVDATVRAPVDAAVEALQAERAAAVRYASDPAARRRGELADTAADTDRAVAKLRLGERNTVADGADLPTATAGRLNALVTEADRLPSVRTGLLDRGTGWNDAYDQYTRAIATAFFVGGALTGVQDTAAGTHARVLLEFSRAGEALAQENAVLSSARPTGTLDGPRLRLFTEAVGTRRALTDSATADLTEPGRTAWRDLAEGSAYAQVRAVEDEVLASEPGRKAADAAPENTWNAAHERVQDGMRTIQADTGRAAADQADPLTRGLLPAAGSAVLLGLVAVVASLLISVRIGRGLVVELVGLRDSALVIAHRRLPHAMRRLRAGEEIDIDAESPSGPPTDDEAGQVAAALGTVHRAALRAAVERAELADGISGVFVNLARRSQVLVHRQLSLLDSMERRSEDPDELSDLFRLDHLTTRMRRHAESLIILSGAAPGRAWRKPVSLTNVIRAAVSEVEDYARVEVRQLPETAVVGGAVADLTHLLAELVENAAQFSPPHTRVRITGEAVGNGFVVEVEDRGLGMGKESLAEANRRIQRSQTLDLSDSDRLGLFVVSRLAARHDIRVHLHTSPYGGTTAVVLLPTALLDSGPVERTSAATRSSPATDREPAAPRAYARVASAPDPEPVPALVERPALTPPAPATDEEEQPATDSRATGSRATSPAATGPAEKSLNGSPGTPLPVVRTEVPTLRPHRPPDDTEPSDELPRRVRQASLAPQLRHQRAEEPASSPGEPDDDERTPEKVRARMAAYRDGWARGGGRPPGLRRPREHPADSDSSEGDPA
ncbi:nitrate- and nitrite sensing domain-containing protein [Streptomyces sp. NPDC059785]|uniref:sensor histidine kinase n=1 Tax=Streptomyces sp. NPDC059785 TaxID=3346945 RepID=UPI003646BA32